MSLLSKEARAAQVAAAKEVAKSLPVGQQLHLRDLRAQYNYTLSSLNSLSHLFKSKLKALEGAGLADVHGSLVERYVTAHTAVTNAVADKRNLGLYDYSVADELNLWLSNVGDLLDKAKESFLAIHAALGTPTTLLAVQVYKRPKLLETR
jgi:hypothetical protein